MKRSNLRIAVFASAMTCVALGLAGCGVQGTYKDPTGAVTLELKGRQQSRVHHDGSDRRVHVQS